MSPLPDEAVVSGTLTAYVIPPSVVEMDWAYTDEAVNYYKDFKLNFLSRLHVPRPIKAAPIVALMLF